jgi:hypothetical protein
MGAQGKNFNEEVYRSYDNHTEISPVSSGN